MDSIDDQETTLLEEALVNLNKPQKTNTKWTDLPSKPSIFSDHYALLQKQPHKFTDANRHRFSHYADKQLSHLILSEEFNFARIAEIMNYIFLDEGVRFTETSCSERWAELYELSQNNLQANQKRMQDKRASSVSSFADPFSLYNLDEMLDKLQKTEQSQKQALTIDMSNTDFGGYNIFKNSIRQIDDIQGYNKRRQEMLAALSTAQDPTRVVTDRLMHFSPYYERLNEFEVKQEELTEEKMREIMTLPIEMQSLQQQLRTISLNQAQEEWKAKNSKRQYQRPERKNQPKYDIQQDWDDYQSD